MADVQRRVHILVTYVAKNKTINDAKKNKSNSPSTTAVWRPLDVLETPLGLLVGDTNEIMRGKSCCTIFQLLLQFCQANKLM